MTLGWAQLRSHYRVELQQLAELHGDGAATALAARAALRTLPLTPPDRWTSDGPAHAAAVALAVLAAAWDSTGEFLEPALAQRIAAAAMQAVLADHGDADDAPSAARAAIDTLTAPSRADTGALAIAYAATAALAASALDPGEGNRFQAAVLDDAVALDEGPEIFWARPLWPGEMPAWFGRALAHWEACVPWLAPVPRGLIDGKVGAMAGVPALLQEAESSLLL